MSMKPFTELKDKRVLVTGASGFIGKYLLKALLRVGADVVGIVRQGRGGDLSVPLYVGDITDPLFMQECILAIQPQYVFHLAAAKSRDSDLPSVRRALLVNLGGTLNLLQPLATVEGLRRVVVACTAEEYGNVDVPFVEEIRELPTSPYSLSKLCVSHLCGVMYRLYGLPAVVLRPTLAYGPGQSGDMFLPKLIASLAMGREFPMSPGRQTRDYIFVDDIVDAFLRAAVTDEAVGQIFNIGSGKSIMIADLALLVQEMLGKSGLVRLGDIPYRSGDVMSYAVDTGLARKLLGWTPHIELKSGLKQTIEGFRREPITT